MSSTQSNKPAVGPAANVVKLSNNSKTINEPNFIVYRPSNISSSSRPPPPPDDYFDPTPADLKAAQETLSARTHVLMDAPLELRAVREAREQSKRDRWPNTAIRVRFSDRTQLERVFPSTDKIRSVYVFVRNLLRDDVKSIKFILYQSPPKRDLKVSDPKVRDLNLAQLQLAPSSILLLRFEEESLNSSSVPAPLLPSVLAQAIDLPTPPNYDTATPESASMSSPSGSRSSNIEKKIPKWLKMGLKK